MKISSDQDLLSKAERSVLYEEKEWVRGRLLGRGSFGSVYMAFFPSPKTTKFRGFPPVAAVKSTEAAVEELMNEKEMLFTLKDCPFIIRSLGHDITVGRDGRGLVVNLFLELASGGTLVDLIEKSEGSVLPEKRVRRLTKSIVGGLKRMHELGFVHRDMKLENVLLVKQGNGDFAAKVADLGLARGAEERGGMVGGTMGYWAPEVAAEMVQGRPADVWALGCVVFGMLTGKLPWEVMTVITGGPAPSLPDGEYSREAVDFVDKCFKRNPRDRATAEELSRHPFLRGHEYETTDDDNDHQTKDDKSEEVVSSDDDQSSTSSWSSEGSSR